MIEEIWKDIPGYEQLYQISNMGRVKSLERNVVRGRGGLYKIEEKILKCTKDKDGYLRVNLCKDGKTKNYLIHRLVASTFLPNPDNLPQLNHIDEYKTNNCVDNLEYCTAEYNMNYGTRLEHFIKSKSIPILQFSFDGEFIKKWDSTTQVKRELGINQGNISKCLRGKRKSSGGYIWKYAS